MAFTPQAMILEFIQPLLEWIAANATWAGVVVFLIALSESLAIVGLFMPGAVLMFAIGALIATGALAFWPTMLWAALGAVVGDGISFWLGYHYKERLKLLWPFSRYPKLMARGEGFFSRHGGKSILIGRFVGPVRPIIPVVAGMMGMSPLLFSFINILSALLWAPAYLLPGMAFAASLGMAAEVGGRLVVLVLIVLVSLLFAFWLAHRLYRYVQPRASHVMTGLLRWSARYPRWGTLLASVIDPKQPEIKGIVILSAMLVGIIWFGISLLWLSLGASPLAAIDQNVSQMAMNLRTPWANQIMIFISAAGRVEVLVSMVLVVALWLVMRLQWLAVVHWLSIVLYGFLLPLLMAFLFSWQGQVSEVWSLTLVVSVYGFLAVLVARELPMAWRWLPYSLLGGLVVMIMLAELYLTRQPLSSLLAGFVFGFTLVLLMGTAFWRHMDRSLSGQHTAMVALLSLLVSMFVYHQHTAVRDEVWLQQAEPEIIQLTSSAWWRDEWQSLPLYRRDLEGHLAQPMNVQWAGRLETLQERLILQGWQVPQSVSLSGALMWLSPQPEVLTLPILPHVHGGKHEALRMVFELPGKQRLLMLRLWKSAAQLEGGEPLWLGSITYQGLIRPLSFFSFMRTVSEYDEPLYDMQPFLGEFRWKWGLRVDRPAMSSGSRFSWSGNSLLLRR